EADAAETPRDWLAGIWVNGAVYSLDPAVTTETLAVLADGAGAVEWSPEGLACGYGHGRVGHWCPADVESWQDGDVRGVTRDWRSIHIWDANGYSESIVYPTVAEAKAAFLVERDLLERMGEELVANAA
ncbi:hypothetical protein VWT32_22670, partial [Xanthomonas citri pv. citri]